MFLSRQFKIIEDKNQKNATLNHLLSYLCFKFEIIPMMTLITSFFGDEDEL